MTISGTAQASVVNGSKVNPVAGRAPDAVPDAFAGTNALDRDNLAVEGHDRGQRDRRGQRRRDDAVEEQSRPHAIEPDSRVAKQRSAVAGVAIARPAAQALELRQRMLEAAPLLFCRARI